MNKFRLCLYGLLVGIGAMSAQEVKDTIGVIRHECVGGYIDVTDLHNLQYEMEAKAKEGYHFECWSDNVTTNPRIYTHVKDVAQDKLFRAVFSKSSDVRLEKGNVSVVVSDASIPSYTLTAHGLADTEFKVWNNGAITPAVTYLETQGTRTPIFTSKDGSVTALYYDCEGGSVSGIQTSGLTFNLTAQPKSGYKFISWADGETSPTITYTHDKTKGDVLLRAVFARIADVDLERGHVDVAIANPSVPEYTLTPYANSDATFKFWNNGSTTTPWHYFENEGFRSPIFAANDGVLTLKYNVCKGGELIATMMSDLQYSVLAQPKDGYEFLSWIDGSTTNPRIYTYDVEKGDYLMRAVFTKTEDIVRSGGTVEVAITDEHMPAYQLTATPTSESNCEGTALHVWSNGHNELVQNYLEGDGTLIPFFTHGSQTLKYEVNDCEMGTVEVTPLACGFTLNAVPQTGYCFVNWGDGETAALRDVDYVEELYRAEFAASMAKVGEQFYPSVQEAIDNANGQPVQLLANANESVVISNQTTIDGQGKSLQNLTILCGGNLLLSSELVIDNLYLNITMKTSAQLRGENMLTYANAYVDVQLEPQKNVASPSKWYAFSVPFEVNVPTSSKPSTDVTRSTYATTNTINSKDYAISEYYGDLRATSKQSGWVRMASGTLYPGRFYMLGIDGTENSWRFKKKAGAPLGGPSEVILNQYESDCANRGWNAVGNPLLVYANASVDDVLYAQVYDNNSATGKYDVVTLVDNSFVMACPFFIQVENTSSMLLSNATHLDALHSPSRLMLRDDEPFYIVKMSQNDEVVDKLYVTAREEAIDAYQIGHDVVKMMGGNTDSYIWANGYGQKLCAQDLPYDDEIEYSITMYAAKAGDYTLSVQSLNQHSADVYLLYNGMEIADLSASPCVIPLYKGMNDDYSLRVGHEKHATIPTSLHENHLPTPIKYIKNGMLFIKANGLIYNAQGNTIR